MENSESKDLEQTAQAEEVPAEETVEADEAAEQSADDKLAAELAQVKDQLLRTMAEYDNHRKRTAKEKLELRADIITNVVADFLPVMDNLERALQAECSDENYKQGVQMIYDSFMATLTSWELPRSRATERNSTHSCTRRYRGLTTRTSKAAGSQRPSPRATRSMTRLYASPWSQ